MKLLIRKRKCVVFDGNDGLDRISVAMRKMLIWK